MKVFEILIMITGLMALWLASVFIAPLPVSILMYVCSAGLLLCGIMIRLERRKQEQYIKERLRAFKQATKDSSNFTFNEPKERWRFIQQRTDELLGEYINDNR